jgi:hypothetical protein
MAKNRSVAKRRSNSEHRSRKQKSCHPERSKPQACAAERSAFAVAFAFLAVIPEGNPLFARTTTNTGAPYLEEMWDSQKPAPNPPSIPYSLSAISSK